MTHTTLVRRKIELTINQILEESGRARQDFQDDQALVRDIGLDSLDLAATVVQLEHELGIDPFREGRTGVQTFSELVRLYEDSLSG
ncbi:MAG: phosphopantetheine-binding protein [Planctomycetota bacterium]|nr:phosphopantetheine-binding protein [Planctomycetota bacterium]MDA1180479.1 phosphopantetheine-binding protein [Planctomycetota bacterium]